MIILSKNNEYLHKIHKPFKFLVKVLPIIKIIYYIIKFVFKFNINIILLNFINFQRFS